MNRGNVMDSKMNFKEVIAITIAVYQLLLPKVLTMVAAVILCGIAIKYLF
jgi:hypothetical protein